MMTEQEEKEKHSHILAQNQAIMETSAQLGGILLALVTFILAFFVGNPHDLMKWQCQLVVISLAVASISFFTATTYYLRGTNPVNDVFALNFKGDVFFASALLCLLAAPILLFLALNMYFAVILCTISVYVAWTHLFFSNDHTGIVAFRLTILGLLSKNFDPRLYERCHNTKVKDKWNLRLIVSFYLILTAVMVIAVYLILFP